jgi:hypothetical protein
MKFKHKLAFAGGAAGLAALAASAPVWSHAIVGDRIFPVTLAIDDPGVADELSLPTFARVKNADGSIETDYSFEYDKLITERLAVSISDTWTHVRPGGDGFQNLNLGAKYLAYTDAPHEFMLSAGVNVNVGGTGAARVGAVNFSTITPALFFGKGFGDLPDSMAMLKPIAVTATIGVGFPDPWKHTELSIDTSSCDTTMVPSGICGINVNIDHHPVFLNWGLTFQYSLPYLNAHVREIDGRTSCATSSRSSRSRHSRRSPTRRGQAQRRPARSIPVSSTWPIPISSQSRPRSRSTARAASIGA